MANVEKKNKIGKKKYLNKVDPNLRSFADDPFVIEKAEKAKEFLIKNGVPPGAPPFEPFED